LCLDRIVEHEKPGLSRDIMCFRILNALFQESFEDITTVWQGVGHFMENETLISLLEEKKEQHVHASRYSVTMLNPVSDRKLDPVGSARQKELSVCRFPSCSSVSCHHVFFAGNL